MVPYKFNNKKNKKEKEEEIRRIFSADKHTYNCIMNEINNNTRDPDDIPVIFKKKFMIFQKLKSELEYSNLTESEEYEKYVEIEKNMKTSDTNDLKSKYDGMFAGNTIYDKLYHDLNINSQSEDEESDDSETYDSDEE